MIHYRPSLVKEQIEQLRRLPEAGPRGTIVIPRKSKCYEGAVARRLVGCHSFREKAVDATRSFRGRYIG